jgi:hypothetical protein
MTMTVEALQIIELDAATAPAPMVDHYIQLVHSSSVDATPEALEYAPALLLKLEHLAKCQRAQAVDPQLPQDYLAPWLTIAPQPLPAAA